MRWATGSHSCMANVPLKGRLRGGDRKLATTVNSIPLMMIFSASGELGTTRGRLERHRTIGKCVLSSRAQGIKLSGSYDKKHTTAIVEFRIVLGEIIYCH